MSKTSKTITVELTEELVDFVRLNKNLYGALFTALFSDDAVTTNTTDDEPVKAKATRGRKAAATKADPVEQDDEPENADDARRAVLSKKTLAALKKIAIDMGFDKDDLTDVTKDEVIDAIIEAEKEESGDAADDDTDADDDAADEDDDDDDESDDDSEDDEDEDADDSDDEEGDYSEEELNAMSLKELRDLVASDYADEAKEDGFLYLKAKKPDLIEFILGPVEDEDEDDEEEDEDEPLTEEALEAMDLAELKAVAKSYGITIKRGVKKPDLIKSIKDMADVEF